MVTHIEFLVEEPSMEAFLDTWLRLYLPQEITIVIHPHRGKSDLLNKLPNRLRGYAKWIPDDWRIVVVVDRDNDDCRELKKQLETVCTKAGLATPRARGCWKVATCIAIEELEAWYFGDWDAVVAAYPNVSRTVPARKGYRDPDAIQGGTWENFEKILKRDGYFLGGLEKIRAAREMGAHFSAQRCSSSSFCYLLSILKYVITDKKKAIARG